MKGEQFYIEVGAAGMQQRSPFKPSEWLAQMDFINHTTLFNNVLITVLADQAGGKSTFSTLLLAQLDKQIKPVSITISPPCSREGILTTIASRLHLNINSQTSMASIVNQINERKAPVLVIIDDAQHLPESLIKEFLIAIKNQTDSVFFHLCFISDYSIVATLNDLSADQWNTILHSLELGLLTEAETRTYALQRAIMLGLINQPLTDKQMKEFYQKTAGDLAKINRQLEPFIIKYTKPKTSASLGIAKKMSVAFGAIAIFGVSYLYLNGFYTIQPTPVSVTQPLIAKQQVRTLPLIKHSKEPRVAETTQELRPLTSYLAPVYQFSTIQKIYQESSRAQTIRDLAIQSSVRLSDKALATVKKQRPVVALTVTKKVITEKKANEVKINNIHQQVVEKKTESSAGPRYTIQLIASDQIKDITRLKKMNQDYSATKIRRLHNSKGTWYILTIGEYSTRSQAQAVVNHLPKSLAKFNPWVRPTAGLTDFG